MGQRIRAFEARLHEIPHDLSRVRAESNSSRRSLSYLGNREIVPLPLRKINTQYVQGRRRHRRRLRTITTVAPAIMARKKMTAPVTPSARLIRSQLFPK
jgi:hypothetical protein